MRSRSLLLLPLLVATAVAEEAKPTDAQAVATAQSFLGAIKSGDDAGLAKLVEYPFFQAGLGPTTGPKAKACKAKVDTEARLKPVVACIRGEELLATTIPDAWKGSPSTARVVALTAIGHAPLKKQARLLQPLAKSHTFVEVELVGDGVTYHVVLAVSPSAKVSALLADSVVAE
jgi:hypothetical protein